MLAPLQIGLAVQMHHHFSSRFLIDSLHKHGFCSSYKEVQMFEKSAAVHHNTDIPDVSNNNFVQYACDILWQSSILFDASRPAWSGTMQFINDETYPGKNTVLFMPMIDMIEFK